MGTLEAHFGDPGYTLGMHDWINISIFWFQQQIPFIRPVVFSINIIVAAAYCQYGTLIVTGQRIANTKF